MRLRAIVKLCPVLFSAFFVLFILFSAPRSVSAEPQEDKPFVDVHVVESESGVEAWLVEDHSVPVIAMAFAFRGAGAAQDPDGKQGLARLVSNTLDEGAGDLESQAFQKKLADLAITLRFSSSRDHFFGTLKTLTDNADTAFSLMHAALTAPRFDPEPVERMRAANITRIKSSLADPEWIAARLANDFFFSGHPYARNSGGTISALQALGRGDLEHFVRTHLGRDRLVVAVAGDITPDALAARLDAVFGDLPELGDAPPLEAFGLQNAGRTALYEHDIPQSVLRIMQGGIGRQDPDYFAAVVMNHILGGAGFGSRLTEEVREKRGLTYGIYSSLLNMDAFNGLEITASTKNETAAEVLSLVREEMTRLRDAPMRMQELDDAKAYLIGAMPLALSSTDRIANLLLGLQLDDLPPDYYDRRADAIRAVSVQDVQGVARRLLSPDEIAVVIVGQPANVESHTQYKELPDVE